MRVQTTLLLVAIAGCSNTRNEQQPGVRIGDSDAAVPGGAPLPAVVDHLVLNEVSPAEDFIELYNRGPSIRLEGWSVVDAAYVADDPATGDHRWVLSPVTLALGGRLLVADLPFGLGQADAVRLLDPWGREVDAVAWTAEESAADLCRLPDGAGPFQACAPTPDQANAPWVPGPRCGDDHADADERCDGRDLGGQICEDLGRSAGQLQCAADCQSFLTAACGPPVATLTLVLNEITSAGDDAIELYNPGPEGVDLGGCSVADAGYEPGDPATEDARFVLPAGRLEAGGLLVLRKDVDHGFGLGGSDTVRLYDPAGVLLDETTWPEDAARTSWCRLPDGDGAFSSCEVATFGSLNAGPPPGRCGDGRLDPGEACDGPVDARCSDFGFDGGELACAEDCSEVRTDACTRRPVVVINEVCSSGDDAIELHNRSAQAADLAGWAVADADYDPDQAEATADHLHRLSGTLGPGAWRVLRKGEDHAFGLGAVDSVRLLDAEGRVVDETAWEEGDAAVSWCRLPDGEGPFMACDEATLGGPNR
ncbi:MAG: lamin tail domain-containing protein [bacterium]